MGRTHGNNGSDNSLLTQRSESGILRLNRFLARLVNERYWGKITIVLEGGRVQQIIRTEQTLRLDDLAD